jgi:hypothetical protein
MLVTNALHWFCPDAAHLKFPEYRECFVFLGLQEYLNQIAKNGVVAEIKQLNLTIRDCESRLEKTRHQIISNKEVGNT